MPVVCYHDSHACLGLVPSVLHSPVPCSLQLGQPAVAQMRATVHLWRTSASCPIGLCVHLFGSSANAAMHKSNRINGAGQCHGTARLFCAQFPIHPGEPKTASQWPCSARRSGTEEIALAPCLSPRPRLTAGHCCSPKLRVHVACLVRVDRVRCSFHLVSHCSLLKANVTGDMSSTSPK